MKSQSMSKDKITQTLKDTVKIKPEPSNPVQYHSPEDSIVNCLCGAVHKDSTGSPLGDCSQATSENWCCLSLRPPLPPQSEETASNFWG